MFCATGTTTNYLTRYCRIIYLYGVSTSSAVVNKKVSSGKKNVWKIIIKTAIPCFPPRGYFVWESHAIYEFTQKSHV